jgi:hypothetical protein
MVVTIEQDILRNLLNKAYNYDKICDLFQIPEEKRTDPSIHLQVTERFKTYVTGYMGRKSLYERDTGAAFEEPKLQQLPDPDFTGFEGDEPKG